MKSSQAAIILVVLLGIAIVGLVLRLVSTSPEELRLSGLLPIGENVIDRITIESSQGNIELRKIEGDWLLDGDKPTAAFKLRQFWAISLQIDDAPLIARNTANYQRMGVDDLQGSVLKFWSGDAVQEQFIVSPFWTPEASMCYFRRSVGDDVYGFPCPGPGVYSTAPNEWRDPIIVSIPSNQVESVAIRYLDQEYELQLRDFGWVIISDGEQKVASQFQVLAMLQAFQAFSASDYEPEDNVANIDFSEPHGVVTITTIPQSDWPGITLQLLDSGVGFYRVMRDGDDTMFQVDEELVESFFLPREEYLFGLGDEFGRGDTDQSEGSETSGDSDAPSESSGSPDSDTSG